MKKRVICWIVICLSLLLNVGYAEPVDSPVSGVVAKVTTAKGSLNLRAKASSDGIVREVIPNGTCLLVLEEGESWCLCQWNGTTGYCSTEFLTILRDADVGILDYRVLRQGDQGEDVFALKERLQELGYIRAGSKLTSTYNDILSERVSLFQRQLGLTEDGIASQELQAFLYSERAPQCTQTLPRVRSQVKKADNGLTKEICGCCMGEGCECCGYQGWISTAFRCSPHSVTLFASTIGGSAVGGNGGKVIVSLIAHAASDSYSHIG